ncbi:hypothetical protein Cgig2_031146 [Carnegiea gigantea]|uniref:Pentatricopeptide repeat-containing protein n=1 Tax=Carnegiea gigantea TaxID=171969 RepID=A0A9Q1KQ61_9CARY|nr:hypothetical protein Cgig2_031146 [Carnegiea gigantea]
MIVNGCDLHYYARVLQSCNAYNLIDQGKQLHLMFLKKGILNSAVTLGNRLLQMYMKCGAMDDAAKLFDEMPQRNCFSWNTMIEGYMKSGKKDRSLELFDFMPHKNDFSWNVVISGCAKMNDLDSARMLFNQMPSKDGVARTSIIHGYVRHGYPREALRMFKGSNFDPDGAWRRDAFVLATVIGACTDLKAPECGKQIHARVVIDEVELDSVLGSSLVNLYSKCGDLDNASHVLSLMKEADDFSLSALITGYANAGRMNDARRIFNSVAKTCVVVWNSLISGYVTNNEGTEALLLFNIMRINDLKPDYSSFASVLNACSSVGALGHGKQLHTHAFKVGVSKDAVVACALINMYSKCRSSDDACKFFSEIELYDTVLLNSMINVYSNCGRIQEAKQIFDSTLHKTLISWNSMLAGFCQNGCPLLTLDLFYEMNMLEIKMDNFTLASVISSCASVSSLEFGEQVFAKATVAGLDTDLIVCTSLIDFYCKCGFVYLGKKIFDGMVKLDEASWNSMLTGYATNGYGMEALRLFDEMRHAGVQLSDITFTVVLSACSHRGLIEEARKWFHLMQSEYHIEPGYEHYSCMVDLLARAGCLEEAMSLIAQMPFNADATMWSSILRGCVAHGHNSLGKEIAELIIDIDPENSSAYVQLSGMFASSGDWKGSIHVLYEKLKNGDCSSKRNDQNSVRNPNFRSLITSRSIDIWLKIEISVSLQHYELFSLGHSVTRKLSTGEARPINCGEDVMVSPTNDDMTLVFEDHSNGIVCYVDNSGEIVCEGFDEGPRIVQQYPSAPYSLRQIWLQILDGETANGSNSVEEHPCNGLNALH